MLQSLMINLKFLHLKMLKAQINNNDRGDI